jgi:hypothetical protein
MIKARADSQATLCTAWLERIAEAKAQVAFADGADMNTTPTDSVIIQYLDPQMNIAAIDGSSDLCPAGGTYNVNDFRSDPTCTLAAAPGDHQIE